MISVVLFFSDLYKSYAATVLNELRKVTDTEDIEELSSVLKKHSTW